MFLEEARLAARLNHPNIVQTNEVGSEGQRYFIAMEYLEGRTLNRVDDAATSATRGGLPLAMHLRVLRDVLRALEHAHKLRDFDGKPLGIVHRDVSPHNVFLTYDGQVKLVDFGIAKAADSSVETKTGVLKGKVAYMAPEQMSGDARGRARRRLLRRRDALGSAGRPAAVGRDGGPRDPEAPRGRRRPEPALGQARRAGGARCASACARSPATATSARRAPAELESQLERFVIVNGLDTTTREIGASISEVFAADRAEMDAQIDALVARLREGTAPPTSMPTLAVSPSGTTPVEKEPISTTLLMPSAASARKLPAEASPPSAMPADPPAPVPSFAPPPKRAPALVVVVTLLALVATVATWIVWHRANRRRALPVVAMQTAAPIAPPAAPDPPPPPPPDPAPPPAAAASAPPAHVAFNVHVVPATAHLTIDDRPVRGAEYTAEVAPGTTVRVRASARGYLPRSEDVVAQSDTSLTLTLARAPDPPRPAPAKPAPPPPARPATVAVAHPPPPPPPPPAAPFGTDVNPTGGKAPKRSIDPSNPYAQ